MRTPRSTSLFSTLVFCLITTLFVCFGSCQTYQNVAVEKWYYGEVNTTTGTISYEIALSSSHKNNQTLFRIYNQIYHDNENENTLCTEVMTPVTNYEPSYCYSQKTSAAEPICVLLGDPAWSSKDSIIVLVDCNAKNDGADCDNGIPYRIYFSFIEYSNICTSSGIPNLQDGGFTSWIFILIVIAIGIVILFAVAGGVYWYIRQRKRSSQSYEILQDG